MADRLVGLVTSAGESTRMGGFPKPLLTIDREPFVERLVGAYRDAGIDEVVVVLGYEAEEVLARTDLSGATVVRNDDYEQGMLSSVRTGVRFARAAGADGLFLSPVDYPLIPADAIERLRAAFADRRADADVVHPTVDGERGHPPLFAASTFEPLLAAPDDEGARAVVYDPATDVADVDVGDERVLVDVDTPAEYWRAVKRFS